MRSISITRRLVGALLLLELLSALALICAVTVHEHHVQMQAFDAQLVAATESLMGAVQDAEDKDDNVLLDLRTVRISKDAVYRVEDEHDRILGFRGDIGDAFDRVSGSPGFHDEKIGGRPYRFYTLHGLRIIDPGASNGGKTHNITVVYGNRVRHVWHEVLEEVRFFAIATAVLFGMTAMLMVGVIRRRLSPVHELAIEAKRIHSGKWLFDAPLSAKETLELRPLAQALEAALERVQQSFEQQKRFTSDAAHELKTDVAIVKSSLQLLSMRTRTAEEYKEGLAVSLQDFTRLEDTLQKLLTLARLEQSEQLGDNGQPPASCSLHEAAEEAVHQSNSLAQLKAIEVSIDSEEVSWVPMHRRDAVLLCGNLLVNAIQHSSEQAKVRLSISQKDSNIVFSVQDWGEGISEEDRPHLFDPFYRSDVSRSRGSGGTGLGLSICKAICDRIGGSIDITNHAEGGAVVTVNLPASIRTQASRFQLRLRQSSDTWGNPAT